MALSSELPDVQPPADAGALRVAVVDDSAVVRGLVARWLMEDGRFEVVGRFANGRLAVDGIVTCRPDAVILDIEMPVMDGLAALSELLKKVPGLKVLMASTLTRRNAEISLRALSLGAFDYIPKPESNSGITTSASFREELLRKLSGLLRQPRSRTVSEARPQAPHKARSHHAAAPITLRNFSSVKPRVIAIGSSTGGPQALSRVFGEIGPHLASVPVVITQHMPPTFTAILAEHMGRIAGRPAREGRDGEPLLPGTIYIAPGGKHMDLRQQDGHAVIRVYDGPEINFCRPAVDPLFESVAKLFGPSALSVVLTGMGHDGAAGALTIANAGGSVIAQDEATSVVWGMPGATAAAGACAAVLPLDRIGGRILGLLGGVRS
ncbi:MAG: chemotaxis response regulator protein-glutamate methylesterase [Hyphomicrobiales bacterium]